MKGLKTLLELGKRKKFSKSTNKKVFLGFEGEYLT